MSKRWTAAGAAVLGMLIAATPAEAVIRASGEVRRISTTSYELVVRNTGNESFDLIFFSPAPGITVSRPSTPSGSCEAAPLGFGCDLFMLRPARVRIFSFRTNRAYPTNAGGVLYPTQTRSGDGGAFPVTGPPSPGEPVVGRSQLFEPVRGVVLVRRRGSRRFVRLRRGQVLPDRSELDTRRGTAQITVATDQRGGRATATVSNGRAIVDQKRTARAVTTLRLSEPLGCPARFAAAAHGLRRRGKREIFIRSTGPFRTSGKRATGTSTGTAWRTTDTCSTTTIKVVEGTVRVRDLGRRRTVDVAAPGSYTARRRSAAAPGAAVESASSAGSVGRATKLLVGHQLTVDIPNHRMTDSDIEHTVDFCARGRVYVRSTFDSGQSFRRWRGSWRVVSAEIRAGLGWARLRFRPGRETVKVVFDRRGVRFLAHHAEVTHSPVC